MATVIIPAHNEESVISDCIDSVVNQSGVDKIIIACNGCTDNTAGLVKEKYPQDKYPNLVCLDIEKPSKTNALNEAEKHISSFPAYYIDADTQLSDGCVEIINAELAKGEINLAAPTPQIDTSQSSWPVQQFYKIWLKLPYISDGVIGTCSFIMTEHGRKRFEKFPDIINDDGFVRCCFDSEERANIQGCHIKIRAPRNLYSLIKIKTRARLGNMQLDARQLCHKPKEANYSGALKERLFSKDAIAALTYMAIVAVIRFRANTQLKKVDSYTWEKDLSSR